MAEEITVNREQLCSTIEEHFAEQQQFAPHKLVPMSDAERAALDALRTGMGKAHIISGLVHGGKGVDLDRLAGAYTVYVNVYKDGDIKDKIDVDVDPASSLAYQLVARALLDKSEGGIDDERLENIIFSSPCKDTDLEPEFLANIIPLLEGAVSIGSNDYLLGEGLSKWVSRAYKRLGVSYRALLDKYEKHQRADGEDENETKAMCIRGAFQLAEGLSKYSSAIDDLESIYDIALDKAEECGRFSIAAFIAQKIKLTNLAEHYELASKIYNEADVEACNNCGAPMSVSSLCDVLYALDEYCVLCESPTERETWEEHLMSYQRNPKMRNAPVPCPAEGMFYPMSPLPPAPAIAREVVDDASNVGDDPRAPSGGTDEDFDGDIKYECPECGASLTATDVTCTACGVVFDGPELQM